MKRILAILICSLGVACGQMGGPVELVCDMSRDCQTNGGQCFSCNAGYACGDDGKGDVTCVEKNTFGWSGSFAATGCADGKVYNYSGKQYTACFNTRRQAQQAACTTITDNCN
jgi:hypothetical protein